ncbi:MAG TPA: sugar ABC transporter permease [Candidatus Dormibacteraeota bacterium]|nr:sugar ABC transporter permease [Candidatus Dormibacteraeota bacterium]
MAQDRAQGSASESFGTPRWVLVASLIGLLFAALGVTVLIDPHGGQNLLAAIYERLGNAAGADALRNGQGDQFFAKLLLAAIALLVGVGGIWLLFTSAATIVERFPPRIRDRIIPWVFIAPALVLLTIYLVYPAVSTVIQSFFDQKGVFTLANWASLGKGEFLEILRNNIIWLVVATAGSVGLGLLVAALFDRIRRESLAKVFIFTPLAISLVGATVIWKFVYAIQPPSEPQFGLLNAIWTAFGNKAVAWSTTFPINLPAEMLIMIWLQTGFAMVVLSAAIKGVSVEVLEAARLDGASERQIFFGIIIPLIRGSIVTVTTTVAIATLKIFDIVFSVSGGLNHDNVVAVRMFQEMFQFFNTGRAAALATILFIAVLPVMILNLRNFRRQAAM